MVNLILTFFVTLFGSTLTFFSGFGLGTILLPLFLAFFEPKLAIPAVAMVHFSNSIFKFIFVFKDINYRVLIRFGFPAILAAFTGAEVLTIVGNGHVIGQYFIGEMVFHITFLKILIGILIISFTSLESSKKIKAFQFQKNYLIVGGILSGFFGGLSGHQGALRSLFLKNTNLTKEQLVSTSTAISLAIDITRIVFYFQLVSLTDVFKGDQKQFMVIAILGAFVGVILGKNLLKKTSLALVHKIISVVLVLFGLAMIIGII